MTSSPVDVNLDALVDVVRGITFPTSAKRRKPDNGLIACLRTTNVQGAVEWEDLLFVDERHVRNEAQLVQPGDILVSMSNSLDLVGKCAIVTSVPMRATFGAFIAAVRARNGINPRYIFHVMRSPRYRAHLRGVASTTTNISNINASKLLATSIPLFGDKTQEAVVSKIDELFSHIDEGVRALERVRKLLARYRQSVLKAAVTGELTREWREKHKTKLESGEALLARILKTRREAWDKSGAAKKKYVEGTAPKLGIVNGLPQSWAQPSLEQATRADRPIAYGVLQPGSEVPNGVPLVRVCDVADGVVDMGGLKKVAPSIAAAYPRTKLSGGEVLLTLVGTVGRTAVVPPDLAGANVARAVGVLVPNAGISARWLETCLRHEKTRRGLVESSREVARKTLNLEQVREYAVPVPSEEEQNMALALADELLSRTSIIEGSLQSQVRLSTALRQSTLSGAFAGQLVERDPTDEPVSSLLQRVAGSGAPA